MITIVPANQKVPAYYLNRHFAISFNLPKLGKIVDPTKRFPSLPTENALALVTLAAVRLELGLQGQVQANDGQHAGSVAAWGAEVIAARVDLNQALSAVAASHPRFVTATVAAAILNEKAGQDIGKTSFAGPAQLNAAWDTGNVAPTAGNIVTTVVNNTAIGKNFLTLSAGADVDSDVIRVTEINGIPIDYTEAALIVAFVVNGKNFTFTKATQVVSAAAQVNPNTWVGTFKLSDDEGGQTALKNWSIQNLAV